MATIKDVAKLADVSVTTVSIIINGKAQERRIPQQTCDKVMKAMHTLGYKPNLSARRLRTNDAKKPVIAFYWPLDYRAHIIATFLSGIREEINRNNFDCELVIQTYQNDHISKDADPIIKNSYNGVIIGGASAVDVEFLDTLAPQMPLVLINRESNRYSTVITDATEVGYKAANLFHRKGYSEVSVLAATEPYIGTGRRTRAFLNACSELNIAVESPWILRGENSIEGGAFAAEQYCKLDNPPKAIFCESDYMALGALYTLNKRGIRVPEDVEILAIGFLDKESTTYSIPSISVIEIPTENVATSAASIVIGAISKNDTGPVHIKVDSNIVLRESFKL